MVATLVLQIVTSAFKIHSLSHIIYVASVRERDKDAAYCVFNRTPTQQKI